MKHHKYGAASMEKLASCHPMLAKVAVRALEICPYDITIVFGHRGEEVQNTLFARGSSEKKFPLSKHNRLGSNGQPQSEAIDFAPYINGSIPWNDTHIFAVVAGSFFAAAIELGATLRWGGDWDSDGLSKGDQQFFDYGHIEIIL